MKKHFVWLLLLFPLLLTGCYGEEDKEKDQGDYIWDFINYNIYFSVKMPPAITCWTHRLRRIYWVMRLLWNMGINPFHWKILWIPALICPAR